MNNIWNNLTEQEKIQYKNYCDSKYGQTISFVETGEPMYFDEQGNMIDTKIIIELLFSSTKN